MKNNNLVVQAKMELAEINKEIKQVGNQIQKLQLERNVALNEYQACKEEVNKGFFGRLWDTLTLKRGSKKRAMEESHQRLHDLDLILQRENEKLHQLHFEATNLAQRANKEMFENVVNAGNETIKDVDDVHKRIDELIETFKIQFESINKDFNGSYDNFLQYMKNTNDRVEDALDNIKHNSGEVNEVVENFILKMKEFDETTVKIEKKIDESIQYSKQNFNQQTEQLHQINKKFEEQGLKTEAEIGENKKQIKNATSTIQHLESTFQTKTSEFDLSLNKQEERMILINKKIEDYNKDIIYKVNETKAVLQETNSSIESLQSTLFENLDSINKQLKVIEEKFMTQFKQNRRFEELFEEQKSKTIKLKKIIIIGIVIGSLGLIGSVLSIIL